MGKLRALRLCDLYPGWEEDASGDEIEVPDAVWARYQAACAEYELALRAVDDAEADNWEFVDWMETPAPVDINALLKKDRKLPS